MKYFITGKIKDYQESDIIYRLGEFVLNNVEYFSPFCHILSGAKNEVRVRKIIKTREKSSKNMTSDKNEEFIKLDSTAKSQKHS